MRIALLIAAAACAPSSGMSPAPEPPAAREPAASASVMHPAVPEPSHTAAQPAALADAAPAVASCVDDRGLPPGGSAAEGRRGLIDDRAPYDPAALRARVAELAQPALDGRASGSPGDLAARKAIIDRFRCLGLVPGGADGSYEQPFVAEGQPTANLIGYLPGSDPAVGGDIIIVGAHHDHLGDGYLGANDNASGVAAMLAIAQAVRQHGGRHRTIGFVAFGGEELGLVGSNHFVGHPPAQLPLGRVVYDINLDMVGSYGSTRAVHAMGTFGGLPATAIVKALKAEHPALHVSTGGRGSGSDHEAFCAAGVPDVFFWTPDPRCYHKRCDTAAQLDAAHLAQIARFAGALVERLADSATDLAGSRSRHGCTGR
jgi:hypothetical protein